MSSTTSTATTGTSASDGGAAESWSRTAAMLLPALLVFVARAISASAVPDIGDEGAYLAYARDLTHGYYANLHSLSAGAYLWHGPGFPLVLTPLVALGIPLKVMRLIGPVFLYATLIVFFRMVRPYTSRRVALAVTYALLLYLPFYDVITFLLADPLAILLFTLFCYFMLQIVQGKRKRVTVWAGLTFGLLALTRVEYGWVLIGGGVCAVIWLLLRRRSRVARQFALASGVAFLCCVPWLVYTYSLTSRPVYWANSGGLSLYWMSTPASGELGNWEPLAVSNSPALVAQRATFAAVLRLKPLDQDPRLMHLAIANIRAHPSTYVRNVINNVGRLLFSFPFSFQPGGPRAVLYALENAFLLGAFAIAGAIMIRQRRRLRPELVIAVALIALGFAVHVPVAAYPRFILPLIPVTVWLVTVTFSSYLTSRPEPIPPRALLPVDSFA